MSIKHFFEQVLPGILIDSAEAFDLGVKFDIDIIGLANWHIDLATLPPRCRISAPGAGDCIITLESTTLEQLFSSPDKAMELYHSGAISVAGSMGAAQKFAEFLSIIAMGGISFSLKTLMAPHSSQEFLEDVWPTELKVVHGPLERLAPVSEIPELRDVDSLLACWKGLVGVFPKTSGDEFDSTLVPVDQARELWKRGFALFFHRVEESVEVLRPFISRLQLDLGLPNCTNGRCIAYATPQSSGAAPHFDHNANFIIQVVGEKIWRVAPNKNIDSPSTRFVMGHEASKELSSQITHPFPTTMPEESKQVHLERGSVMFLPSGYWHTTTGKAPSSLSLNFTFSQPSWSQIVTTSLHKKLNRSNKWREVALGTTSTNPFWKNNAEDRLVSLLKELPKLVEELTPQEIISDIAPSGRAGSGIDLKRDWVSTLSDDNVLSK